MDPTDTTCQQPEKPWGLSSLSVLLLITIMGLVLAGCGADDALAGMEDGGDIAEDDFHLAEEYLANNRVDDARDVYLEILDERSNDGTAAAGAATTELLLMLDKDEVTTLLIEHLGASGGIDANELLYADGGLLYWASRGVRWDEESDDYEGVRDLVAEHLPWGEHQLESIEGFVDGLDEPTGSALRQLITVVNALSGIESHIDTAIDDADFVRLYVPGETLHDASLSLRIGRAELSAVQALIELARSAIYFIAAYEHHWTLEDAFGHWRHDPPGDRYIPEYAPADYTVDYLDDHLLRGIDSSDRLSASRSSLRDAIGHARDSIRHGLEEPTTTTLQFDRVDEDDASDVDELLAAVADALEGPTELPHTNPAITLDLGPLFSNSGRTLPEEIPWFQRRDDIDSADDDDDSADGPFDHWELNDKAIEYMFIDDIIKPAPDDIDELDVTAGPDNDPSAFLDALLGSYWERVEDVYFTTR